MKREILHVAIDVDDQAYHFAGIAQKTGEVLEGKTKPSVGSLLRKFRSLEAKGFELKVCYESSYIGFTLCRYLRSKDIACDVIAASLIPGYGTKKKKTDRLDALGLATFWKQGMLTAVHVPDRSQETVRDVVRARGFLVDQRQSLRNFCLSLCRRQGLSYREEMKKPAARHWTPSHRQWLSSKCCELKGRYPALQRNLILLLDQMESLDRLIGVYDEEIAVWSHKAEYEKSVHALMCYRGIERQTAMTLVCELGDIRRFWHPRALVSWLGLDIREKSSGGKEKKIGITQMGNKYARTAVVEACQTARRPPRISAPLARRRKEFASPETIQIADRCMHRLYKRAQHLLQRGKHANKVKVACAREMLGFLWESMHQVAG